MTRWAALAAACLALAVDPGAAHAVDPLGPWPGAGPPPPSPIRPTPARPGDATRQGLERLRANERQNRLEDLRRDQQRRLDEDRLRNQPLELERARRRWRAEDRETDFRRERERQAIESRTDTEERLERAGERPAVSAPTPPSEPRAEFERELQEQRERERLERLRRGVGPSTGPGIRRGPRR